MRALAAIFTLALLTGCGHEPYYGRDVATTQPKKEDVVGSYALTHENISAIPEVRQCELNLKPDGTFSVTNYPTWTDPHSPTSHQFVAFLSTTGRWSFDWIGGFTQDTTNYKIWGVRFEAADSKVRQMAITGKAPAYDGLVMTYGDPDSYRTMLFDRKKKP